MLSLTKTLKARGFRLVLVGVGIVLLTCGPARAQLAPASDPSSETFSPSRGMKPAGSYALSDIEMINMVNGNLGLSIPLAALPKGRGGLSASLNLFYNSKIWDIRSVTAVASRSDGTPESRRYNLIPSLDGSWKYGFDYELRVVDRDYPILTEYSQTYVPCNNSSAIYYFKVFMVFPDGSQHEFRLRDQNDWEGYFAYRPDGTTTNHCPTIQPLTGTMVYYSLDGTYMRLEVQHDADSTVSNNPWTLFLPDGSRVTGGSGPQRVYDRNGNYFEIQEHITFNAHDAVKIEDQLGRRIVLEYGSAPGEDTVRSWSVGGAEVVTRIKWKTISVLRSYNNGQGIVPLLARFKSVIGQIILPVQTGGLAYTFGYNAPDYDFSAPNNNPPVGWGELNLITLPTGGQSAYSYKLDGLNTSNPEQVLTNSIKSKNLMYQQEYDGSSTSVTDTWTYVFDPDSELSQVTAPDGGTTKMFHYVAAGILGVWFSNLTYKTEQPDGSVIENLWNRNTPYGHPGSFYADNPYVKTEYVSIPNSAGSLTQTAIKDYTYDKNGNVTRVDEYDWVPYASVPRNGGGKPSGIPNGIQPKRITLSKFAAETPGAADLATFDADSYHFMTAPHLLKSITSTELADPTQTLARTEFTYDDPLTIGNMIQSRRWDSTKGSLDANTHILTTSNSIVEATAYNQYGSPTLRTDARGVMTQVTYAAVGGFTDLYPTKIVAAFGTPVARTDTREYDFNTGLITRTTDVDNGLATSVTYDVFGRPTLVKQAEGRPEEAQTSTLYFDTQRRVLIGQDLIATGDQKLVVIKHYDQLGRIRLSRQLEDSSMQSADDETQGIKVQTRYAFSATNSFVLTSNPYRAASPALAINESTIGWTRTKNDNGGRLIEVQTFSGNTLPAPWGPNSASTGLVGTVYDGVFTTLTDQAGKTRRSKIDALGRLIRVDEPNADNNLGAQGSPSQDTNYEYDALGNLTSVKQGTQTPRTFNYTSLSLLRDATNPENGKTTYDYDAGGNLTIKTDPRFLSNTTTHVTINYVYDALNRVISRSYNDGTPNVTYTYDAPDVPNSKGRVTKVSSSVSANSVGAYDVLGRVKLGTQTTDQRAYVMGYEYNLAGALVSMTYPSGRVVKTDYDPAGRTAGVKNNATGVYYAGAASTDATNRLQYSAAGGILAMKLGNGLWEHTNFNSRLQATQVGLGATSTTSTILQLDYNYGTTGNNGNLQSQTITVPTVAGVTGFTATQTYSYDALNRLASAQENSGTAWKQNFSYDRFGNRNLTAGTTLPASTTGVTNPKIDPANNRIGTTVGQENIQFDNAGNLTRDVSGGTYAYDADNRMVSFNGGATTSGGASYSYDGSDQRVKKVVGGFQIATTVFVYDIAGQLIAEYADSAATGAGTSYVTGDTLGSPRVITDSNKQVKSRHDYLPFGEELFAGTGGRTAQQNFAADNLRQKFTSKERDNETGLDFFEARYYSSTQGRFTSADPFTVTPARVLDPQQLNLYGYVRNNPLVHVDPTGMIIDTGRLNHDELKRWQQIVGLANAKDKDGNYLNPKLHEEYDRLNRDDRTFFIENHDFGSKSQTIGNFEITKFKGEKDFSEAVIQLDFKRIKNLDSPVAADEVPGFKKFDKLFGVKNDAILRLAELFGHEGAHGVFALDDIAGAVKLQQQLNERDAAFNSLPKGKGRYPFPPDVIQKMNAADKALIPTERYAQQVEKIINGELRAPSKRKN